MILAWALYSLVVGLLCVVAAAAAERLVRELGRPVRWVWAAALALTVGLSAVAFVRARTPVEVPVTTVGAPFMQIRDEATASQLDAALTRARELAASAQGVVVRTTRAVRSLSGSGYAPLGTLFTVFWLSSSAGLLIVLGVTLLRMRSARSRWRRHRIGDQPVMVSNSTGPALVGFFDSVIVIPAWLLDEPDERQRLVVRHEREHQRAGDHFLLALACAAVCVLPWNPALWWMLKRTRLAVELDCDARVLRSGAEVKSYGMLLLDIAGHAPPARAFTAPALVDAHTHLERRVLAMMNHHRTGDRARALACAALALTLGVAACTTDMPTAAQLDDMDVARAQEHAVGAGIMAPTTDGPPAYIVDGVIVPESVARAIPGEEIESIQVLEKDAAYRTYHDAGANGAMLLRTRTREGELTGERTLLRTRQMVEGSLEELEVVGVRTRDNTTERAAGTHTYTPDQTRQFRTRSPEPLILVDGKPAGTYEMRQLENRIESIELLKGDVAKRIYDDPRAAGGVVRITTKKKD